MTTVSMKCGVRWWVTYAIFAGWIVYYTLQGRARDRFGDWFPEFLTRNAYWTRVDGA